MEYLDAKTFLSMIIKYTVQVTDCSVLQLAYPATGSVHLSQGESAGPLCETEAGEASLGGRAGGRAPPLL